MHGGSMGLCGSKKEVMVVEPGEACEKCTLEQLKEMETEELNSHCGKLAHAATISRCTRRPHEGGRMVMRCVDMATRHQEYVPSGTCRMLTFAMRLLCAAAGSLIA